jgi:hypothetical protein
MMRVEKQILEIVEEEVKVEEEDKEEEEDKQEEDDEDAMCDICYEDYNKVNRFIIQGCRHKWHVECLKLAIIS